MEYAFETSRPIKLRGATLALIAAAAVTVAALATPQAAHAEPTKLKFAYLGLNTANIYFAFGVEKGIYARHDVDLDIVSFQRGGPEIIAAAASQQVDLGALGTPILAGISRGFPIKIVGAPAVKGQEFVLVTQPDIASVADLKGKTVGVAAIGGGQAQALQVILKANGVEPDDVDTIAYGSSGNGYVALKSGQIAGAILSEPNVSKIVVEGSGKVLAEAVDYYGRYQHSYVFATDAYIAEHPDTIRAFFAANAEAIAYAQDHRDELLAFAEKTLKLDRPVLEAIFDKQLPKWDASQAIDEEGLLNAIRIVKDVGDIDAAYEPDLAKIVDTQFQASPKPSQ